MAAQGPVTVSFPFNLGMRNTSVLDDVQPVGERPELRESVNTRLSRVLGAPTKSPRYAEIGDESAPDPAGLIPSRGSALLLHKHGNSRVTSEGFSELRSHLQPLWEQNAHYAYDLVSNREIPGGRGYASPAVAIDHEGNTWIVQVRENGASSSLFVTVLNSDGEVIVAPTAVQSVGLDARFQPWCGVTTHVFRDSEGQVTSHRALLWWRTADSVQARRAMVVKETHSLSLGTATTIYSPTGTASHTAATIAVHSDGSDLAFLATRSSSSASTLALTRVEAFNALATTTVTRSLADDLISVAVRHVRLSGAVYVACGIDDSTKAPRFMFYGEDLDLAWDAADDEFIGHNHRVACALGAAGPVFAASNVAGDIAAGDTAGTKIGVFSGGSLDPSSLCVLPWKGLVSNGASDVFGGPEDFQKESRALFAVQNVYNEQHNADTTKLEFLADPAIELYRCTEHTCSMVGRFAVDSAVACPAVDGGAAVAASNNLEVANGTIVLTYLVGHDLTRRHSTGGAGFQSRIVRLSTDPGPVRYALDAQGLAMLPSAYWDGTEVAEWCATSVPKVYADADAGQIAWAAGTYLISAVVQWRDATGQLHRSFPATPFVLEVDSSEKPLIRVTLPATCKDGRTQERYQIQVYASTTNGSVLYAQPYEPSSLDEYVAEFNTVAEPQVGSLHPQIYTDGSAGLPLGAQCPPTFVDRCIIGERAWGTDGREIWFTKPKEFGIAFEWSSEQVLQVPAAAGGVVALSELSGMPLALCERGAWVIPGQGPDAALGGQSFSPPEQVAEIPCTDRRSVVKIPSGVLFVSGDRFALVGPGVAQVFEEIDASALDLSQPVHLHDSREVVFFSRAAENPAHVVYNYELNRWTVWDEDTIGAVACAAYDPLTRKVLTCSPGGELGTLDPSQVSQTAQMRWATGWIRFGGPEDDNAVTDILIRALYLGAHDLRVTLQVDYGAAEYTYEIEAAQLHPSGAPGEYYTVLVQPPTNAMRALRLVVEETNSTGDGMRPVSCTVQFGKAQGVRRAAILATARA